MVYAPNGFIGGHAQNSNKKVNGPRRACRSLCKIVDESANSNMIWNYSTVFRKII
jgi:hypothetical protein